MRPLTVVFRADAGVRQGMGHVMRSLTLAQELRARGHRIVLVGALPGLAWLRTAVDDSGIELVTAQPDELEHDVIAGFAPDRVVVDSYEIDAASISRLNERTPVLAIVDGDDRGIDATWYLDQNLAAEDVARDPARGPRFLAGAPYALVRGAVLDARRPDPWRILGDPPRVLSVMGGTDPAGLSARVAASLAGQGRPLDLTVIAPAADRDAVVAAAPAGTVVVEPTVELPRLLAGADVVVSAAGTTAWDLGVLGVPSVLVGVIANQSASLAAAVDRGVALGVDAAIGGPDAVDVVGSLVARLLDSEAERRRLSQTAQAVFDGRGAQRVAAALEAGVDAIS